MEHEFCYEGAVPRDGSFESELSPIFTCPECGAATVRNGRNPNYFGCTRYPLCLGVAVAVPYDGSGYGRPDSYRTLLLAAWARGVLVLSGPRFLGGRALWWMYVNAINAFEREDADDPIHWSTLETLPSASILRGVLAADWLLSWWTGQKWDLLRAAHVERVRTLIGITSTETGDLLLPPRHILRALPLPKIVREYMDDFGDDQFEASLTSAEAPPSPVRCVVCAGVAEPKHGDTSLGQLWSCGNCGAQIVYEDDYLRYAYNKPILNDPSSWE